MKEMDFNEAEKTYRDLKSRHNAGQLSNHDFEVEVNKLTVTDSLGREWMIGVKTGKWYYAEGEHWVEGVPPRAPLSAPAVASATPTTAKGNQRLLIIGGVVVVIILLLLAAGGIYLFLSTQPVRIANLPTPPLPATPTRAATAANTVVLNAPPPNAAPTDQASLPPVALVTPTQAPLPTNAVIATTTFAAPLATNTTVVAVKPGVYVTNIRVDPQLPKRGEEMTFYVTFLNTTSQTTFPRWRVEIWDQDPSKKNSLGVTDGKTRNIPVGRIELPTVGDYKVSGINNCLQLRARVVSENEENQRIPITATDGGDFWFNFGVCP